MRQLFEKEEIEFKRKRTRIFNGALSSTQLLSYAGDFAKVVITQTAGVTASLTVRGKTAGLTVQVTHPLTGNTILNKELGQRFNELISKPFIGMPSL